MTEINDFEEPLSAVERLLKDPAAGTVWGHSNAVVELKGHFYDARGKDIGSSAPVEDMPAIQTISQLSPELLQQIVEMAKQQLLTDATTVAQQAKQQERIIPPPIRK